MIKRWILSVLFCLTVSSFSLILANHFCPQGFNDELSNGQYCTKTAVLGKTLKGALDFCKVPGFDKATLITVDKLNQLGNKLLTESVKNGQFFYRVNAFKVSNRWRQLTNKGLEPVDFSHFPYFNQNGGSDEFGLIWTPYQKNSLFVISPTRSHYEGNYNKYYYMQPLCVAPKLGTELECKPQPNCCGHGTCTKGLCQCHSGYRSEAHCCCLDAELVLTVKSKRTHERLSGVTVMYRDDDGMLVSSATDTDGNIVIKGCAGRMKFLDIPKYCLQNEQIVMQAGKQERTVAIAEETSVSIMLVDIATGKAVAGANVQGGNMKNVTDINGHYKLRNCQGYQTKFDVTKPEYCDNGYPVDAMEGRHYVPLAMFPKITYKLTVVNMEGDKLSGAQVLMPGLEQEEQMTDASGLVQLVECFGFTSPFLIQFPGHCPKVGQAILIQSPLMEQTIVVPQEASLEVKVVNSATQMALSGIDLKLEVSEEEIMNTMKTDAGGLVTLHGICQGQTVDVSVVGGACVGSYSYQNLNAGMNQNTLFVTCP